MATQISWFVKVKGGGGAGKKEEMTSSVAECSIVPEVRERSFSVDRDGMAENVYGRQGLDLLGRSKSGSENRSMFAYLPIMSSPLFFWGPVI